MSGVSERTKSCVIDRISILEIYKAILKKLSVVHQFIHERCYKSRDTVPNENYRGMGYVQYNEHLQYCLLNSHSLTGYIQ